MKAIFKSDSDIEYDTQAEAELDDAIYKDGTVYLEEYKRKTLVRVICNKYILTDKEMIKSNLAKDKINPLKFPEFSNEKMPVAQEIGEGKIPTQEEYTKQKE